MSSPQTVAIVGLGLMGGSLARDLAARKVRVLGFDADAGTLRRAQADGVIALPLDATLAGAETADLVVVATPVDQTAAVFARLAPKLGSASTVTDLGSTKSTVQSLAESAGLDERFVGSHPMAGDHRSGWAATRTGLYQDATIFLCPAGRASERAHESVRALWESVGGRCTTIEAAAHDALMAWVSHLPQIASSAVAAALASSGHAPTSLGRGGRDVTRLAASSPEMWSAICRTNAPEIANALGALSRELADVEAALRAQDDEALRRFFSAGREWLGSS